MAYCCSECSFTAQFESALMMHRQLHHDSIADYPVLDTPSIMKEKSHTLPRQSPPLSPFFRNKNKGFKLPSRTSSATRLLGKLKATISKSRTLFSHPEEPTSTANSLSAMPSECTSKALKKECVVNKSNALVTCFEDQRETYACHLCSFDTDRITVLDRHLLNDHKIGLENLLKLVMAKTKLGLSDDQSAITLGIRQPYYRTDNEIIEEGEFIIETVTPKIKILKHASTNTDAIGIDNFKTITSEIETLLCSDKVDNEDLMGKMQTLNEYMCKFVSSSNALKKALNKEIDIKNKEHGEGFYGIGLGDNTPRDWERAHSEKMERNRSKYQESSRGEKSKTPSDSFYF